MPRFVVLRHEVPPGHDRSLHWDLMLESAGALKTWSLPLPPNEAVGAESAAEALADHRLAYLDYEGPVSGDRGSVSRWDRGEYALVEQHEDAWIVDLAGARLRGRLSLRRASDGSAWHWHFTPLQTLDS